jgi:hypothetical protein
LLALAAEAKAMRETPAREQKIQIVPRRALEREQEQEMGMVTGM